MDDEQVIVKAREENPELGFDSDAVVFRRDDSGAYVQAWVWVEFDRRVIRGGSWGNSPQFLRSAVRIWFVPGNRVNLVGFRLVRGIRR